MTMKASRQSAYHPEIDGLRAIAVLAVVLFHFFPNSLRGGFVGVDIFFVISGYLISAHIFDSLEQGRFSFRTFYAKRIKRIYPALITVLTVTFAFGFVTLFSSELIDLCKETLAAVFFVANVYLYKTQDYFAASAHVRPLLHLWSLGVEEQFYIVFPIGVALLWRYVSRSVLGWLLVAATLVSLAISVAYSASHPPAAFYLPVTRAWEFLFGTLLTWAQRHRRPDGKKLAPWMAEFASIGGIALLLGSVVAFNEDMPFPGWLALLPTAGSVLIIAAGSDATINRLILQWKPMRYVGLVSYPLYLWHWPILVYTRLLSSDNPTLPVLIVALLCAFLLASLTYHFIENPLRSGKLQRRGVPVTGSLSAVMLLLGVLGFAGMAQSGLPTRFPGANPNLPKEGTFYKESACSSQFPTADFCVDHSAGKATSVMLLGDSHAQQLVDAFSDLLASRHEGLIAVGAGSCVPFYHARVVLGTITKDCDVIFDKALNEAIANPHIDAVVFSNYAVSNFKGEGAYAEGSHIQVRDATRNGGKLRENNGAVYLRELDETLQKLTAANKHVYFVLDNPELDFGPTDCLTRPIQISPMSICGVSRKKVDRRLTGVRTDILKVLSRYPTVVVLDPLPLLCDSSYCYARRDKAFLYLDDNHLSSAGSKYVVSEFFANWHTGL